MLLCHTLYVLLLQVRCRNRHGKGKVGRKVTGLAFLETREADGRPRFTSTPGSTAVASTTAASSTSASPCFLRHHAADSASTAAAVAAAAAAAATAAAVAAAALPAAATADDMSARYDMLTTTGDSRMRLWRLDSFEMTAKYKGLVCDTAQIAASFSDDGRYGVNIHCTISACCS
jgi:hypothetical protein